MLLGLLLNPALLNPDLTGPERPIVLVVNNNSLATIRAHQERRYPGRVSATDLRNPDFPALARAFGRRAWDVPGLRGAPVKRRSDGKF